MNGNRFENALYSAGQGCHQGSLLHAADCKTRHGFNAEQVDDKLRQRPFNNENKTVSTKIAFKDERHLFRCLKDEVKHKGDKRDPAKFIRYTVVNNCNSEASLQPEPIRILVYMEITSR